MTDEMNELLAKANPEVHALALKARDVIREAVPDAQERVYPGPRMISYGYNAKMKGQFSAIITHTTHVNMQFARGTELHDPEHLLEGTGKKVRHVKIRDVDAVNWSAVQALLKEAAALTRAEVAEGN